MLRTLKRLVGMLPFIGHALVSSPWKAHLSAGKEVGVGMIFSAMPIWLGALIVTLTSKLPPKTAEASFADALQQGVVRELLRGELLLLGTSMLATVLYLAITIRPFDANRPFPGRLGHAITVVLLLVTASCVYFVGRNNETLSTPWLMNFSLAIYAISLVLWYTACVYDNELGSYERSAQEQDKEFRDEYSRHREAKQ